VVVHRDSSPLNGLFRGSVNYRPRRRGRDIRGYLDAAAERHKKRESYRVPPLPHVQPNGEVEGSHDHVSKARRARYFDWVPPRLTTHASRPPPTIVRARGAHSLSKERLGDIANAVLRQNREGERHRKSHA